MSSASSSIMFYLLLVAPLTSMPTGEEKKNTHTRDPHSLRLNGGPEAPEARSCCSSATSTNTVPATCRWLRQSHFGCHKPKAILNPSG